MSSDVDTGEFLTSDSNSDTRFLRTSDKDMDSDTGMSENLGHGLGRGNTSDTRVRSSLVLVLTVRLKFQIFPNAQFWSVFPCFTNWLKNFGQTGPRNHKYDPICIMHIGIPNLGIRWISGLPMWKFIQLLDALWRPLFLVIKPSWSQLGTSSKLDSGRLKLSSKSLCNLNKKYAFRPEPNLELFQVQIRTDL